MHKSIFSLVIVMSGITLACASPAQEDRAGKKETAATPSLSDSGNGAIVEDVPYASVNGSELRLDIYGAAVNSGALRPAVLLIHGGSWRALDKGTMRRMGQFLARSGFVAFAINYRLWHDTENRWPAQLDDAQRAVRWVRANASKYGVDPEHLGAFGHSAGGQLASLLGMEETRNNSDPALAGYSSKVQAVVDVSGPTDFTVNHDPEALAGLANLLGTEYSKDPEVWRKASPALQVSKEDSPFLIVHGTQDQDVPISQSQELFEKLRSAGVPVSFVQLVDAHTFQTPEARRQLAFDTLSFFQRYLRSGNG